MTGPYGVLFEINDSEKEKLGIAEGLGNGYCEESVDIVTTTGTINAVTTYVATKKKLVLTPYH